MIRLRVLPLTIFAASLLLTVKVGGLWDDYTDTAPEITISPSLAQQAPGERPTDLLEEDGDAGTTGAEGVVAEEEPLLDSDALTDAEIDVLQRLRDRRRELDAREARLDMRENTIMAAEHTLESRIEDWKRLKTEVEGLMAEYESEQEQDLKTLAIYYEKMKPKDAARVFNELELSYLVDIVERMKNAKAAVIIGKMETAKAKMLTVELAEKRVLKTPTDELIAQY